jgi:hypothetical protein
MHKINIHVWEYIFVWGTISSAFNVMPSVIYCTEHCTLGIASLGWRWMHVSGKCVLLHLYAKDSDDIL